MKADGYNTDRIKQFNKRISRFRTCNNENVSMVRWWVYSRNMMLRKGEKQCRVTISFRKNGLFFFRFIIYKHLGFLCHMNFWLFRHHFYKTAAVNNNFINNLFHVRPSCFWFSSFDNVHFQFISCLAFSTLKKNPLQQFNNVQIRLFSIQWGVPLRFKT